VSTPGLTYAASEESSSSVLTPSSSTHSSASSRPPNAFGAGAKFSVDSVSTTRRNGAVQFVEPEIRGSSQDTGISGLSNTAVPFPEFPIPARPTTPGGTRKLLKKKSRGDGYESDGGYMSETGKKKDKKTKKDKKKADEESAIAIESEKEAKKRAAKEEKKEQEEERKRKKSFLSAAKALKKTEKEAADQVNGGYDTDSAVNAGKNKSLAKSKTKKSKSKTESPERVGYETDGAGYQSSTSVGVKKSKSRFFNKLSGKSSRTDLRADVEPVPALPSPHETEPISLPIAERFATSLSPATLSTSSLPESRPTPSPVSLPSSQILGLPPPLPPLNFQSFSTSTPGPPTSSARALAAMTTTSPINRSSHSSSGSSSSSDSKRYGARFSPTRDAGSSHGHGFGSGSFSTITSSSHQHSVQHHMPTFNPAVSPNTPNSLAHSDHPGSGSLKPPSISYPNTRTPSPSPSTTMPRSGPSPLPTSHPPVAPLQIAKGLRMRPSWENSMPPSKKAGSSSSPISPASPFVPTGPLRSTTSSPALVHPLSHLPPSPNPMGGYLPRSHRNSSNPSPLPVISPPNTAITEQPQRLTHLTITPSSDYLVPSPRNSSLPSPNVLAYYDIPPPSPPPMGPLPSVPAGRPGSSNGNANANASVLPSPAALRQRLIDRAPRQFPSDIHPVVHPPSNIQRGREQPFPSRPVLPVPGASQGVRGPSPPSEVRGLARRYGGMPPPSGPLAGGGGGGGSAPADIYANSRYQEEKDRAYAQRGLAGPGPKQPTQRHWIDDDREDADSVDDNDSAKVELRDVLDRYDDGSAESGESHYEEPGRALGRSRSIEAMKGNSHESFPVSEYYGARARIPRSSSSNGHEGEYQFEDGRAVGDRMSRWSGSIYSRASILDEDESGETRDRLVKRVEEMLDSETKRNGGAGRGFVPPVPRLPDAYTNGNMGALPRANAGIQSEAAPPWNRF